MSWTQADVDAIDAALKNSTLRVRYNDREVTYRSADELLKIRQLAVQAVQASAAAAGSSSLPYTVADFTIR